MKPQSLWLPWMVQMEILMGYWNLENLQYPAQQLLLLPCLFHKYLQILFIILVNLLVYKPL